MDSSQKTVSSSERAYPFARDSGLYIFIARRKKKWDS